MAFLDEDDALPADDQGPSRRGGGSRQGSFLARRLLFLLLFIGFVILVVIAFRGCLDARKERSYDNYVRDLVSITTEAQQLSQTFFERLQNPGDSSELDFTAEISNDRATAQSLLERVQGLDAPGDLAGAQAELEQSFELRRDAIGGIAEQIDTALSNEPDKAVEQIAGYMRYFLASDVLYERSREDIATGFADAGITQDEKLPDTPFLPEPIENWLDSEKLETTLLAIAGESADVAPGLHGVEVTETTINGTILSADTANTISGGAPFELEVLVTNGGENDESDVPVDFSISGGTESIEGDGSIPEIKAGLSKSAKIEITPDPTTGDEYTLEVNVGPVPGEELVDNNTSTYTITFE